jgi:hypothetical protein
MRESSVALVVFTMLALAFSGCFWGLSDFNAPLTGGYTLWRTSAFRIDITSAGGGDPMIPTMVIECNHDNRFIIAKRQGLRGKGIDAEPDPSVFDYWILDTKDPEVHGPLSLKEYSKKREQLRVPSDLALKDVYSFRPSD